MADNIEYQDKGELVANCDQLQNDKVVVTTPVESRIMSIRGNQIMIDRDLAELVANCDRFNSLKHSTVRSNVHYVGSIKDPNGGYGYPMIKDYSDFLNGQQKLKNK